eukprot:TRINITY_DN447_c2_g1_i1.p1 TRINITY_DN447_c2_g1~~TRINITY_DN447_c2_g1_i1.p1  ORF type:complete len:1116 (-),score=225.21 TRINITY_DN447_c2_g1_i1:116-3463(-)
MKLSILAVLVTGALSAKIKYEKVATNPTACLRGYETSANGCVDTNECTKNTHNCAASNPCVNTMGSFQCRCSTGYVGTLPLCVNVNECTNGAHTCNNPDGGIHCVDTTGSFDCGCKPGWENLTTSSATPPVKSCVQINECTKNTSDCHVNASCIDTHGSFRCSCNAGYAGNGTTCTDLNECQLGSDKCSARFGSGSTCNNTVGSFECVCRDGWTKNSSHNNDTCYNIDECNATSAPMHNCHANASCSDTIGSFLCRCNDGYGGNGVNCSDVDECRIKATCLNSPPGSANCSNTEGSFECKCNEGWWQENVTMPCKNYNECTGEQNKNHSCAADKATCADTPGSFLCNCKVGWMNNGTTGNCVDVDECLAGKMTCTGTGQNCSNTAGSFKCACADGWDANGSTVENNTLVCIDKDECTSGTSSCHSSLATCKNTIGSFSCACNAGYIGDGVSCTDFDQCAFKQDNCSALADCEDKVGSFECKCKVGYYGDGYNCTDIDECNATNHSTVEAANPIRPGSHQCTNATATCHNTPGSYICRCQDGYSGNGVNCANVNECALSTHTCPLNTKCTDTVGSFTCECKPGFKNLTSALNLTCVDIDECADNAAAIANHTASNGTGTPPARVCNSAATCTNTHGSYHCKCPIGLAGDGLNCQDIDECQTGTHNCDDHATCTNGFGSFKCQCKNGYNGTGTKYSGGWPAKDGCWDNNECVLNTTHTCKANGSYCVNTPGSFTCKCKAGYWGDGLNCTDVDECTAKTHICHAGADCNNTDGSYTCKCRFGFMDKLPNTPGVYCSSAKVIEVGQVAPKGVTWNLVKFKSTFAALPVVVASAFSSGDRHVAVRVKDVSTNGFSFALSFAATADSAADAAFHNYITGNAPVVNFIAAAQGNHTLPDGTVINAGRATIQAQVDSWCYSYNAVNEAAWTAVQTPYNYTSRPVILSHIQGVADKTYPGGVIKQFCVAGSRFNENTQTNLTLNNTVQVTRVCSQPNSPAGEEQVGWITIGHNNTNHTSNWASKFNYTEGQDKMEVDISTTVNTTNFAGGNSEEFTDFNQTFTSSPIVIGGKVTTSGRVYGWLQPEGALTNKVLFKNIEDPMCQPNPGKSEYFNLFASSTGFIL